jgi:hypothetical protein
LLLTLPGPKLDADYTGDRVVLSSPYFSDDYSDTRSDDLYETEITGGCITAGT